MTELKDRIKTNVEVFLKNGYRYYGELLSVEKDLICIHDFKTDNDIFLAISEILKIEVKE